MGVCAIAVDQMTALSEANGRRAIEESLENTLKSYASRPRNASYGKVSKWVDPVYTGRFGEGSGKKGQIEERKSDEGIQSEEPRIPRTHVWVDGEGNPLDRLNDEEELRWKEKEERLRRHTRGPDMQDPKERSFALWKRVSPEVGLGTFPKTTKEEHFAWTERMNHAKDTKSWRNHLVKTMVKQYAEDRAQELTESRKLSR